MPQAKRSGSGSDKGSRKGARANNRSAGSSGGASNQASSGAESSGAAKRSSAAKSSGAAKRPSAGRSSSSSASSRSRATSSRRASGAGAKRRRSTSSQARAPQAPSAASGAEDFNANLAAFRDFLQRGMEGPLHLVMLTNERIQEVVDDAADRGRMTRDDAEELAQEMVRRGRQQTADLLGDFEHLLGRGRGGLETAATAARKSQPADRVLREVDRARRAAGLGQSFPILSYEDLTAAQVADRLDDLSPAELRKVRDHERRHGNRKTVLQAIEVRLG